MEQHRVTEETRRQLADDELYDQGGILPPALTTVRNDTGQPIAVVLTRGSVVMSQASLDALSDDMRERLFGEVDVITAEEALAALDELDED